MNNNHLLITYVPIIYVLIKHHLYNCREFFTNQPFIMQNEPNFGKAQMNVTSLITADYENKTNWTLGENEPKTNPIKANQSQLKPIKCQNKPNTKPNKAKQSQFQTAQNAVACKVAPGRV